MDDLAALARVSAELGSNRLLIQAAGGNTSVKADGVLWVKASGRWLAKALDEPIFAALDLPRLTRAMALGDPACETCDAFVRADLSAPGLRPSVETTLHAGLPQRFVLHVHCVETISNAVLEDGAARIAPLLDGLKWAMGSLYASRLSVVPDDYAGRRRLRLRQSRAGGRRRHARGGRRLGRDRRAAAGAPDSGRPDPVCARRRTRRLSLRRRAGADDARGADSPRPARSIPTIWCSSAAARRSSTASSARRR